MQQVPAAYLMFALIFVRYFFIAQPSDLVVQGVFGYAEQESYHAAHDRQRAASVTDERQGDAGVREQRRHDAYVGDKLNTYEQRDAEGKISRERSDFFHTACSCSDTSASWELHLL